MKNFKKTLKFIDADKRMVKLEIELTDRNNYPELTICGDYCGGGGQVLDHINPRTHTQTQLVEMWENYHLKEINQGQYDSVLDMIKAIKAEQIEYDEKKEEKSGDDKILEMMEEQAIDDDMLDACKAYLSNFNDGTDLEHFDESYQGEYVSDKDFALDIHEQIGEKLNDTWPGNCIDWEIAARELMYDYFEVDGYYFRNI